MQVQFYKRNKGGCCLLLYILPLLLCSSLTAAPEKVRLRLAWKNQFQFAGYYMAKEEGYYQQEGLEVEILESDPRVDNVKEVVSGRADFAVGRSSILINLAQGADIVALLAAYQHSPAVLLTLGDSGLATPESLRGERIMFTPDVKHASEILAMLMKSGLREKDYIQVPHSFNVDDLVNGKTDAMVAYVSNELYQLRKRGIKYNVIHPKDHGFDLYSDILFTSGRTVEKRGELVNKFYRASMRGWLYAFEHINETAEIIHKHYNTQNRTKQALIHEGEVLKKHAFDEYGGFGTISIPRLRQMMQIYLLANLLDKDVKMDRFVYQPPLNQFHLSSKELEYISTKDAISMCVTREWMPYEDFVDGQHKGIVAGYIELLQKKIGVPFTAVPVDSVKQAREYLQSGMCEIISSIVPTVWGGRYHNYTLPYLSIPLSIATSGVAPDQEMPESIAVIQGTAFEEIIRVRHPEIKVIPVENGMEGLDLIKNGTVKGMLCTGGHINSMISEHNVTDINVNDFANEEIGISVAVARDNDLLLGLINKAIRSITHKERQNITSGWINVKPKPTVNPDLLWKILFGFGSIVVLVVFVSVFMARHNKHLRRMAGTDWLTKLPNRHNLIRKLEEFLHHSNRYSRAVSLIYFDVDDFKAINDRFGHNIGDEVLKEIAQLIIAETRVTDACGRWGGEEFILASLESDKEESSTIAEKLRKRIETHDFGLPEKVTCSFGVTQYIKDEPIEHFIHRADLALYEAKSMGKNRVVVNGSN